MGKMQRTKGHSYEREIANRFKEVFPDAKRHLESQVSEAAKGKDLENTGMLRIQCKRMKQYAPISRIEEVKEEGIPVLVTKGDRTSSVVVLYLEDFLAILKHIGVVYESKKEQID